MERKPKLDGGIPRRLREIWGGTGMITLSSEIRRRIISISRLQTMLRKLQPQKEGLAETSKGQSEPREWPFHRLRPAAINLHHTLKSCKKLINTAMLEPCLSVTISHLQTTKSTGTSPFYEVWGLLEIPNISSQLQFTYHI